MAKKLVSLGEKLLGVLLWLPLLLALPIGFFRTLPTMKRYIAAARM